MGKLVHFLADGTAVEIRLDRQRITIGRRPDNDFCLPYPAVSGEHAAVVTILADSFLEDLGSTNGTLVNGTAVAKHFLRDRDRIDVGQQILVYLADDAATLEPPPRLKPSPEESRQDEGAEATQAGAAPRPKRRSDFVASAPVPAAAASSPPADPANRDGSVVAAVESAVAVPVAVAAPAVAEVVPMEGEPALKVVTGAKAGRIVALVKDETLIGRAGVQVVAIRRGAAEVRVVPVEGATPPCVNGMQVVPEGRALAVGDILEVAGTKLEVIAAARRPSA